MSTAVSLYQWVNKRGIPTIEQGVQDVFTVPVDEVVDVTEDATGSVSTQASLGCMSMGGIPHGRSMAGGHSVKRRKGRRFTGHRAKRVLKKGEVQCTGGRTTQSSAEQ